MESGRLPSNIAARMEEVYHNYRNAVSNDITHVDDVGINHQHFLTMPFYVFFPCQIFKFGYRVSARQNPNLSFQEATHRFFIVNKVFYSSVVSKNNPPIQGIAHHLFLASLHSFSIFYRMCFVTSQVLQSGNPKAREIILSNMAVTLDRILLDVEV